jgi:tetratricopeptide (TPR) repeat protein
MYANRGVLRIREANHAATCQQAVLGALTPCGPAAPLQGLPLLYLKPKPASLAEAITDLERAIAIRPNQYQAYVSLAQIYQGQGIWDRALGMYGKAIKHEPNLAFLYRMRARLHLEVQNLEAALDDFARALEKETQRRNRAKDHAERGRILHLRKRYQEAVCEFDAALALWADYANAHLWRADALLHLQRHEPSPRLLQIGGALTLGPLTPFHLLPDLLVSLEDHDAEVVRSLDAYLAKGGKPSAEVYRTRGRALERLHRSTEAIESYSRALDLQPNDPAAHVALGWLYLSSDAPRLARGEFDKAVALDPANGAAYSGRGLARARLGQFPQAVADAEMALGLLPENPRAQAQLLCNAARTFALAVGKLDRDSAPLTRRDLEQRSDYQDRALGLIERAMQLLPEPERALFWRDRVFGDPSLSAIRRSPGFVRLSQAYSAR